MVAAVDAAASGRGICAVESLTAKQVRCWPSPLLVRGRIGYLRAIEGGWSRLDLGTPEAGGWSSAGPATRRRPAVGWPGWLPSSPVPEGPAVRVLAGTRILIPRQTPGSCEKRTHAPAGVLGNHARPGWPVGRVRGGGSARRGRHKAALQRALGQEFAEARAWPPARDAPCVHRERAARGVMLSRSLALRESEELVTWNSENRRGGNRRTVVSSGYQDGPDSCPPPPPVGA